LIGPEFVANDGAKLKVDRGEHDAVQRSGLSIAACAARAAHAGEPNNR
jgi:hypothetical protein